MRLIGNHRFDVVTTIECLNDTKTEHQAKEEFGLPRIPRDIICARKCFLLFGIRFHSQIFGAHMGVCVWVHYTYIYISVYKAVCVCVCVYENGSMCSLTNFMNEFAGLMIGVVHCAYIYMCVWCVFNVQMNKTEQNERHKNDSRNLFRNCCCFSSQFCCYCVYFVCWLVVPSFSYV